MFMSYAFVIVSESAQTLHQFTALLSEADLMEDEAAACGSFCQNREENLARHVGQISMSVFDVVKQKETTIVGPIEQRIAFQQNSISSAVQSPFSQDSSSLVSSYGMSGTSVGDIGTSTELFYPRISLNTYPTPGEAQQLPGSHARCTDLYSTSEYNSHDEVPAYSFVSADGNRGFSSLQGDYDGLPTQTSWTPDTIRFSQQPDALESPAEHYPLLKPFKPVVSHALLPGKTCFSCDLEDTQASTGTSRSMFPSLADQPKLGTLPPHVRPDLLLAGTSFQMQDVENALRLSSSSQLIQSAKGLHPFRHPEHPGSNPRHSSGRNYPVPIAPDPVGYALKRKRDEEYFNRGRLKTKRRRLCFDSVKLNEEEQLLLNLREEQNLPWKEIAARIQIHSGKSYKVPALQMRFTRLRKRLPTTQTAVGSDTRSD